LKSEVEASINFKRLKLKRNLYHELSLNQIELEDKTLEVILDALLAHCISCPGIFERKDTIFKRGDKSFRY
jgi:hypothetical protein